MANVDGEVSAAPLELLTTNRRQIADLARRIGRRQGIPEHELDDFVSEVMIKLVEGDCAVLRAYQGRSSLLGYLSAVILHLAQDQRNHRWGKWHPSAEALRLGREAQTLERLLYREGLSLRDAGPMVRERFPGLAPGEVDELAARLPIRCKIRRDADAELDEIPARDGATDDGVIWRERGARQRRVLQMLARARAALDPTSRLILARRFEEGRPAEAVARELGLTAREVYRLGDRAKARLRRYLESRGVDAATAVADLGWDLDAVEHDPPRCNSPRLSA